MKTSLHSITVQASADHAWHIIGDEFAAVDTWMAANPTADVIPGDPLPGAPVKGRNSYLIKKLQPIYQEELITAYSKEDRRISTSVTVHNTPRFTPMLGYVATIKIDPIDAGSCKITYRGEARAKWYGMPMKGLFTKTLHPGFLRGLEELGHYIETGEPHPRKIEKIESEALLAEA